MLKAFMISFRFNRKNYLAMISAVHQSEPVSYTVTLYNEDLFKIIPQGELTYSELETGMLLKYKHPLAKQLLHAIHDSVLDHLKCREYQKHLK